MGDRVLLYSVHNKATAKKREIIILETKAKVFKEETWYCVDDVLLLTSRGLTECTPMIEQIKL